MKTFVCIAMTLALACGGKKEQPAPAQGSAAPVAAGSADGSAMAGSAAAGSGSAQAAAEPVDVPTEVDFEELANSEITDKNVEARVKEIEAELAE